MRLALHVHYRPFSVTSEESLRDSELPLNARYLSTKGQEVSVCQTCACAFTLLNLYTLSANLYTLSALLQCYKLRESTL